MRSILFYISLFIFLSCNAQENTKISLGAKAKEAYAYCLANNMDTNYCILVDMSIHSGKNRLFVWDFNSKKIELSGICSHGSCDGTTGQGYSYREAKFSNEPNSYCSSKGKYKIGNRGYSNWGIHVNYKIHGMEPTNSNAYKRIVVLHSWKAVPNEEIYPEYAPNSLGCPMVSNEMMTLLDNKLKHKITPVLLWIYND